MRFTKDKQMIKRAPQAAGFTEAAKEEATPGQKRPDPQPKAAFFSRDLQARAALLFSPSPPPFAGFAYLQRQLYSGRLARGPDNLQEAANGGKAETEQVLINAGTIRRKSPDPAADSGNRHSPGSSDL